MGDGRPFYMSKAEEFEPKCQVDLLSDDHCAHGRRFAVLGSGDKTQRRKSHRSQRLGVLSVTTKIRSTATCAVARSDMQSANHVTAAGGVCLYTDPHPCF